MTPRLVTEIVNSLESSLPLCVSRALMLEGALQAEAQEEAPVAATPTDEALSIVYAMRKDGKLRWGGGDWLHLCT